MDEQGGIRFPMFPVHGLPVGESLDNEKYVPDLGTVDELWSRVVGNLRKRRKKYEVVMRR